MGKDVNIYSEIERLKNRIEELSKEAVNQDTTDEMIEILARILDNNNLEIERCTIKRRVNKYNYEHYLQCNEYLKKLRDYNYKTDKMKFNTLLGKINIKLFIVEVEKLNQYVEKNISDYEKSLK